MKCEQCPYFYRDIVNPDNNWCVYYNDYISSVRCEKKNAQESNNKN